MTIERFALVIVGVLLGTTVYLALTLADRKDPPR